MAIPVTNIPVLTGEVAERFVEQCEYKAQHLAGSQWSQEREDRFKAMEAHNAMSMRAIQSRFATAK